MIQIVEGNLVDATENFICHQVNCQGKMNSGVAKTIRTKWPQVYSAFLVKYNEDTETFTNTLGEIQVVPLYDDKTDTTQRQHVVNMFCQFNYGYDGKRYTSYDAFWEALNWIKKAVPKTESIAFPYGIGCGRGGANWHVIYSMIEEVLGDYRVTLYKYEEV
jgi:O-acetyl-ADP-ribose deacetylase (regulator of RNase III)